MASFQILPPEKWDFTHLEQGGFANSKDLHKENKVSTLIYLIGEKVDSSLDWAMTKNVI